MFARRLNDQRGVAMITVLFVGAGLTAVASAAAFAAVNELRSGINDRKSVESLSYAESGVDRLAIDIKRNRFTLGQIRTSGCPNEPTVEVAGSVGDRGGTFNAKLTVWPLPAPSSGPDSCAARSQDRLQDPKLFAITSVGRQPTAKRVVRVLVRIMMRPLPLAVYANNVVSQGGNPKLSKISLFTPGNVEARHQIGFAGTDPVYYIGDFWCPDEEYPFPTCTVPFADQHAPSAVHAVGGLECDVPQCGTVGTSARPREHSTTFPLHCEANNITGGNAGTPGQSQWDQSGDGGPIPSTASCASWNPAADPLVADSLTAPPPTSLFTQEDLSRIVPEPGLSDEEYLTLKEIAQDTGIYCRIPTSGATTCTRSGQPWTLPGTIGDADLTGATPPLPVSFVAYFDYENAAQAENLSGPNVVKWQANWPTNAAACDPPNTVIMVVRNGSFELRGNTNVNGFALIPEGTFWDRGTGLWNGPIIANTFNRGGSTTFTLTECWFGTAPAPFLEITPIRWQEVDR